MSKEEKDLEAKLKDMEEQASAEASDISEAAGETAGEAADVCEEVKDEASDTAETTETEAAPEKSEEEKLKESLLSAEEKYLRLLAEFQNYKKRATKEKADIHAYANEKIINDLFPVLDNFERALGTPAGDDAEAYAKGMVLIFEQLKTALVRAGLKEIEAIGETFDPNMHNAVMMEESKEYESGKVSQVLQKGYTLNDKVVRPAMVAVSK